MKILEKKNNHNPMNSIGKGSSLQGSINSKGDIRIDGSLKGSLTAVGRLVLGETGSIDGEVTCGSAIIAGELNANIKSKELLILKETAKLYGDIKTEKLSIEPGAMFSGKCKMGVIDKIAEVKKDKHEVQKKKIESVKEKKTNLSNSFSEKKQ